MHHLRRGADSNRHVSCASERAIGAKPIGLVDASLPEQRGLIPSVPIFVGRDRCAATRGFSASTSPRMR